MNLNFLNDYWTQDSVTRNKHFLSLNDNLKNELECHCIPEDKIKTLYKGYKRWDLHIPDKKIAIEYKTIASEQNQQRSHTAKFKKPAQHKNLKRNIGNRIEEAIGCAIDLKHKDPDYKTGYIMVVTLPENKNLNTPKFYIDSFIKKFDKMVTMGLYDFFCPIITFGIDNHAELSKKYTIQKFVNEIKNSAFANKCNLEEFFV